MFVTATRIGDAVLSTGLLAHLIERYPDARITIAAGPEAAPLFQAVPGVERLITVSKRPHRLHWLELYRAVAFRRWSLVVDLRGSALAFLLWARERRVVGKGDPRRHRVDQLAEIVGLSQPPAPRIWTAGRHEAAASGLVPAGAPVLAIGPAANWPGKTWPAERFAELAVRLTGPAGLFPGGRVAVLAAAHERRQAEPLLAALPDAQRIDLVGRVDLLTAAAVLRRCRFFIGNDTGIMHLAAAVGTPTLGLFGPSPPAQYAPWGTHTAIVTTTVPYAELVGTPDFDHRTTPSLMDTLSVDAAEAGTRALWQRIVDEAAD